MACEDDLPTLENFAYGDTPTEAALRSLVTDLLGRGGSFAVNLTELADRHDIRQLVLRTALTYLELLGVLRQGTPFYAGYRVRLALDPEDVVAQFSGEPARFLADLLGRAKRGRTWLSLDPEAIAAAMNQPRERVVRALEVLEERGHAVVEASDVRHRFTRLAAEPTDPEPLVGELQSRFERREAKEIERLQQVMELVDTRGCQTNALVGYFGEQRSEPCGHCSGCKGTTRADIDASERAARAAAPGTRPAAVLPAREREALLVLMSTHAAALGEPRQLARFLCGLTSPAVTRARLSRHSLFGALAERRFAEVLAYSAELVARP